jgi:hypothetical protein
MKLSKQFRNCDLKTFALCIIIVNALSSCGVQEKSNINARCIVEFGSADSIINQVVARDSLKSNFFIIISRDNACNYCFFLNLHDTSFLDSRSVERYLLSETNFYYDAGNELFIPVIYDDMTDFLKRDKLKGVFHHYGGTGLVSLKYNSRTMKHR